MYECDDLGPFDYDYTWIDCVIHTRTVNHVEIPSSYDSYVFSLISVNYGYSGFDNADMCDSFSETWGFDTINEFQIIRSDSIWQEMTVQIPYQSGYFNEVENPDTTKLHASPHRFLSSQAIIFYSLTDLVKTDSSRLASPGGHWVTIPDSIYPDGKAHFRIEFVGDSLTTGSELLLKPFRVLEW